MAKGGGGDSKFAFSMLIFAMAMTLLLPIGINIFASGGSATELNTPEQLSGYYDFTGTAPSKEAIWSLTGIFTPYGVDENGQEDLTHYGYSDDGWLYGTSVNEYRPSQYSSTDYAYTVVKGEDGLFRYAFDNSGGEPVAVTYTGDHRSGTLYTDVSFDPLKKSPIFFSESMMHDDGYGRFHFDYGGYRYSFQPTSSYTTQNTNGDNIEVVANSTSLSLIWYQYYTSANSGISGQLIISSQSKSLAGAATTNPESDGIRPTQDTMSVAYLTSSQIIQAFNSTTSTARFTMNFSGIPINIYIKIDPIQLANGLTVQQCYDLGYWSVMVTSLSTDSSAYMQSDNSLNPYSIFETVVDLLTFNYTDYGISEELGILCSLLIVVPFYAGLIAICIGGGIEMLIMVGILAAIEAIATIISKLDIGSIF